MIINLSPIRSDKELKIVKLGDALTINGESFDFGLIPDDAVLPDEAIDSNIILGDVTRKNGEIELTILCPHGPDPSYAQAFPQAITITNDGEVPLP
ncbi:hypothetical protein [Desulfoluna butyratoxydans]|uniref:hypothetical protein n=1 Tax=Desulfoluna butyratoxydans TaxID=231438 RepID=UPI0015D16161|nr:hypothetical protein [Desulfoluna butyratoxydans]